MSNPSRYVRKLLKISTFLSEQVDIPMYEIVANDSAVVTVVNHFFRITS